MGDVTQFRGRQPPPPPPAREPQVRPIGVCWLPDRIVTANVEPHLVVDEYGDSWMPISYIMVSCGDGSAALCLMSHAPPPPAAANDD